MNRIKIQDNSGDKKYFTQIPNMIINHSTAYEQSLYLVMKRIAGETGSCFASLNFLSKKLGIAKRTINSTIAKLLKREWIKEINQKKVKGGNVRQFIIVDLWKLNIELYESGTHVSTKVEPEYSEVEPEGTRSGTHVYPKKNYKEEPKEEPSAETSSALFVFSEYLKKMGNSNRRHINVIGHYFEEKGLLFDSEKEVSAAIKRHLRAGVEVANFSDDKIVQATSQAKKEYKDKWTVETILKILTR